MCEQRLRQQRRGRPKRGRRISQGCSESGANLRRGKYKRLRVCEFLDAAIFCSSPCDPSVNVDSVVGAQCCSDVVLRAGVAGVAREDVGARRGLEPDPVFYTRLKVPTDSRARRGIQASREARAETAKSLRCSEGGLRLGASRAAERRVLARNSTVERRDVSGDRAPMGSEARCCRGTKQAGRLGDSPNGGSRGHG